MLYFPLYKISCSFTVAGYFYLSFCRGQVFFSTDAGVDADGSAAWQSPTTQLSVFADKPIIPEVGTPTGRVSGASFYRSFFGSSSSLVRVFFESASINTEHVSNKSRTIPKKHKEKGTYPFTETKNFPIITSCTATPLILLSSQDITSRYIKARFSRRLFWYCFSLCSSFSSSGFMPAADK